VRCTIRLDAYDVVDNTSMPLYTTNHANTVVGYKEGSACDPVNPDN
jgi:hypothetical protein